MNKKAIVTGANGQLGRAFVEALIGQGYFVYAVDLNIEKTIDWYMINHKWWNN